MRRRALEEVRDRARGGGVHKGRGGPIHDSEGTYQTPKHAHYLLAVLGLVREEMIWPELVREESTTR